MKRFRIITVAMAVLCVGPAGKTAVNVQCNRQCLAGFMTAYLNALLAHDSSKLPLAKNVKYTENGVRLGLNDGLWKTASAMPTYRLDVVDEEAGSVGLLGKIDENGNHNWFATRLKIENGRLISEIENLVVRSVMSGASPDIGAPIKISTEPHPLMKEMIPEGKRLPRAQLVTISNSYFTGLDTDHDGAKVDRARPVARRPKDIAHGLEVRVRSGGEDEIKIADGRDRHELLERIKWQMFE